METRVKEGRTALAITILLIVTLTVPTLIVSGGFRVASAQQSPSPTGTAPTIELVNPSDYEGTPVLSDKDNNPNNEGPNDDPNDEKYHFNAWTRNAPNNATVEFFIVENNNTHSLGAGTNRGGGVYDLYSAIPNTVPEGAATVRAVLFAGGELDRDEQAVAVNQVDNTPETEEMVLEQGEYRATNQAETLEITYPENTGGVGFFGRPGQPRAASVEVRHSRTGTAGDGAEEGGGPESIRVYYTVSHRGTDPDWKNCNTGADQADASDGIRCQLASGDSPEWVTGIAAVTMDAEVLEQAPRNLNAEEAANAGDAHVAVGYNQVPTGVTIASPPGSTPTGCSPLIPVTVTDQIGRKIVGAPVDVHAVGPTDSLAVNTEDTEQGTAQTQPDNNDQPENHATEQGRKCSDGSPSAQNQGVHAEAGALPDRKHIESTDHTDGNGQFVYRLWSNAPGGTTMTAFVDMDENDRHCASEAAGNGIVNWGNGGPQAPLPAGPEEQVCNQGTASASSTSPTRSATTPSQSSTSASPTQSATTASPTATASRTGSPTVTPSQTSPTSTNTTSSPSTPGSTASSPQQSAVEVTLETSQPRKTFGKSFTLTGSVTSDNTACTDLINVRILRDVVGGQDDFELWAQETTDANGAFSVSQKADVSATYIAEVLETATCDDATSAPQPVLVRAKVILRLSRNRVPEGARVRFTIKTAPCPLTARDRVLLFRAIEGEFGKAGRKQTNQRCVATITRRVNKTSVFQARWPKQTAELLAGKSRAKAVRVRND
ncbi:MAG TPA: hypothetical protein VEV43_04260 [Actinomycetota bacterium]|nr:hypothetical protein [Actinomycetota bacterium]